MHHALPVRGVFREDVGFVHGDGFSVIFHKMTGSFFIKDIKVRETTDLVR